MRINLKSLADKWPSTIVARDRISEFSGGLITRGTIANLDSKGFGPPRFYLGPRKIGYPVETLIPWLEHRIEAASAKPPKAVKKHREDRSYLPSGKRAVDGGSL